jgi:hypothetical protein
MSDMSGGFVEWWSLPIERRLSQKPKIGFDVRCQRIAEAMEYLEPLLKEAAEKLNTQNKEAN